ncbi:MULTISPECIES: toxin-antitoxin system YwqK family antitoxin [Bizionia]|uniref:Toxin-antitoxin system YwqK family antitoxin n=1 Tax=Bizionia algoritergicola TaxID=291187 RepID=A0A5D0QTR9_9FLAO|nr:MULTISPECIES: preprotein translocase YidC [Bizionia]OBX23199.1 preprotein translocase YidC [Bizionia sp. APA-3]TYB71574.1 toxin-antitoxin system YwqK family antitoxin [Bizionia algoritergicola]
MKQILFVLALFMGFMSFAQTLNQFDANGKRDGKWKKNFEGTDVVRYEGAFQHGKEIGVFKFYKNIKGEPVLTATRAFNPNTDTAKVTFLGSTGKVISEGFMRDKTYIGEWKYYHNNGTQIMTLEHYSNKGLLEGARYVYYLSGQVAEKTLYEIGKLHGKTLGYAENGTVIKEHHYKMGNLHGEAKFYDEAGGLLVEGSYRNDQKHGIWKYYENGTLKEEKDFTPKTNNPYKKSN